MARIRFCSRALRPGFFSIAREADETGERQIWVERTVADRLLAMRGPGEGCSDVILRLVELEAKSGDRT